MFRPPFTMRWPVSAGERPNLKQARPRHRAGDSFSNFRKKLTDVVSASLINLPIEGKLFEIYFVRLIGTPNQVSKYDAGVRAGTEFSSSRITRN
jgi:hypothetical protein